MLFKRLIIVIAVLLLLLFSQRAAFGVNLDSLKIASNNAKVQGNNAEYLSNKILILQHLLEEGNETFDAELKQVEKEFNQFEDSKYTSTNLLSIAQLYESNKQSNLALKLGISAFKKSIENNADQSSESAIFLARLYNEQGTYDKSYKILLQSLTHSQKISRSAADLNYELGNTFYYQSNLEEALKHYTGAYDIYKQLNHSTSWDVFSSLGAIGSVYGEMKEIEKSLLYHEQALWIAENMNDDYSVANASYNVAVASHYLGQYSKAASFYEKAITINKKLEDHLSLTYNYLGLSSTKIENGEIETGKQIIKKVLQEAEKIDDKSHLQYIYQELSNVYFKSGNLSDSHSYLSKYVDLKDSLINEQSLKELSNIKTNYEIQKAEKDTEIALLKKDANITQMKWITTFCSLLALLVVLAMFYSRYKLQLNSNKALESKNLEIEKRNRELIISNQALEQFAHIASHDLKEPLRSISSFSSLLNKKHYNEVDDDSKEFFGYISDSVNRMYNLLEDILAYSKLNYSEEELHEDVNTKRVLDVVLDNLDNEIIESGVKIETKGEFPTINGSFSSFIQLFENLISNAIKFHAKTDKPVIKISCTRKRNTYVFAVNDNGIGISRNYHEKIFHVFKRLNPKHEYPGNGIGLAICKKLVEKFQGKIWVESKEGKGSTFFVSLPS